MTTLKLNAQTETRVREYGRLFFWVQSRSRADLEHLVDLEECEVPVWRRVLHRQGGKVFEDYQLSGYTLEPYTCTCEAFEMHKHRPCPHIIDVLYFLRPRLEEAWPERWSKRLFDLIEDQKKAADFRRQWNDKIRKLRKSL